MHVHFARNERQLQNLDPLNSVANANSSNIVPKHVKKNIGANIDWYAKNYIT
jgi:hypothetical protein